MSNLRLPDSYAPSADAMVATFHAIAVAYHEHPAMMSTVRWRILTCIADNGERRPSDAVLRMASGLNSAALDEHLTSLRWRGLVMLDSVALSPAGAALVAAHRRANVNGWQA